MTAEYRLIGDEPEDLIQAVKECVDGSLKLSSSQLAWVRQLVPRDLDRRQATLDADRATLAQFERMIKAQEKVCRAEYRARLKAAKA